MSRIKLKKLFSKKNGVGSALGALLDSTRPRSGIQDANGDWLYGKARSNSRKAAIEYQGETLGWVVGKDAARVAALVAAIAGKEAEKIALAGEVLDKYREINLLYKLSEKLAATLDLNTLANIALTESSRSIRAQAGKIVLRDDAQIIAAFGDEFLGMASEPADRIATKTMETGTGEIVNAESGLPASFLCAPLKSKDQVIGVILLVKEPTQSYNAADLKLLSLVASEAAPVIENAIRHTSALFEARQREERLKKQIEALQIQIDESQTARQVAEITETDYFQSLRRKAERLRYGTDEQKDER